MDVKHLQQLSEQITARVMESDWYRDSSVIHCFAGSIAKGEIATAVLLQDIIQSGRQLVMPRMTDIPGILSHHRVTDPTSLVIGKWGIPEPSGGETVTPKQLDLVIVPGLAVDLRGNRIGFGMGYYDRFLVSTPAKTMMLLPHRMILNHIPVKPHDIPVHAVATEQKILLCHGNNRSDFS